MWFEIYRSCFTEDENQDQFLAIEKNIRRGPSGVMAMR